VSLYQRVMAGRESRILPPPEPPLDALQHQAQADATAAQILAFSGFVRGETDGWKDPFGLDETVFGPGPGGER
jgi:hypothetical protein